MSCCALSEIPNILPVYLFSTVTDHYFLYNIESFLMWNAWAYCCTKTFFGWFFFKLDFK